MTDALNELLKVQQDIDAAKPVKRPHAQGWEPGIRWEGSEGVLTTGAMPAGEAPNWEAVLRVWGLDPAKFQIVEPVLFNAWGDPLGVLNRQWKGKVVQRVAAVDGDMTKLLAEIKRFKPTKPKPVVGSQALVVALSDIQMGKGEGGGSAATVQRLLAGITEVADRYKQLQRQGVQLDRIVVVGLGDVVESCQGHYDMQAFQTDLDRREQVTVLRRLLVKAISHWSTLTPTVIVAAIPGNHGENRNGNGKAFTTFGDNDDVAVFEQVAEVIGANAAYDHVAFTFPKNNLTMTLDVHGTVVGLAHGHQVKGGVQSWWAKQALGLQPVGDAQVLLTGHLHHLVVTQSGARTHIQAPSLDGGSQWFTETAGASAPAGLLTLTVGAGGWDNLRVLPCQS
jgi:predicted phosphodiesterase